MSETKKSTEKHFCNCPVTNCPHHPSVHGNGCDSCIKKNLQQSEIPTCFYLMISDDVSDVKEYTLESFVNFYLKNKKQSE